MPTTASRAYRYPSSTDDVRPYEDIQFLATDVDTDVQAIYAPAWVAFNSPTLTWTASISNPTLGNGTLVGRYQLQGSKGVRLQILLTYGSTSLPGNGFWIFNLPFTATADAVTFARGVSHMDDVSTQGRPGGTRFFSASQIIMDNSGGVVSGGSPAVAGTGDKYGVDITYDRV
jgi:hypothetical protein